MRVPFSKPWRAFPEFDGVPDADCERYVRDAMINHPRLTVSVPVLVGLLLFLVWPTAWVLAVWLLPVRSVIPLPTSMGGIVIALVVSTVLVAGLGLLLTRDLGVYIGLKREMGRAKCPKCAQSLLGVPVQSIGSEPDPAKQFVRCPECGKKYCMLDIGLTPRDLIPFEQRVVDANVGATRQGAAWGRRM